MAKRIDLLLAVMESLPVEPEVGRARSGAVRHELAEDLLGSGRRKAQARITRALRKIKELHGLVMVYCPDSEYRWQYCLRREAWMRIRGVESKPIRPQLVEDMANDRQP